MKFSNAMLAISALATVANGFSLELWTEAKCTGDDLGDVTIKLYREDPVNCVNYHDEKNPVQSVDISPDPTDLPHRVAFYAGYDCGGDPFVSAPWGCVDLSNIEGSVFSYSVVGEDKDDKECKAVQEKCARCFPKSKGEL